MQLGELKATQIEASVLNHLIRRNLAIGAVVTYGLDDLLYAHDTSSTKLRLHNWSEVTERQLQVVIIRTKLLLINKIIAKLRATDDINEKRAYLLDALIIEREINETIYG